MVSTNAQNQPAETAAQGRSTRDDWLKLALQTLIRDGIDRVKIQIMAKQLNVSRSSFYWFFESPQDLYEQMLDHWLAKNTGPIIQRALRPAQTISEAILNVFECWVNEDLFDPHLDVAVRLWARRAPTVLQVVASADQQRLDALTDMFARHNFSQEDALVRARVLYFTQIGQYTLDIREDMMVRISRTRAYLQAFSGQEPTDKELARFETLAFAFASAQ
ncbi:TetR/AcrR family transcriptional regulator [Mesorhizobium sp. DCY119]|uniref:TetR/AcrR family transcriptional regulator n=1 Tax=Mesorhizobium sp. DCY119 TaxID=2108445 RepID=UPI000E739CE1|nr:TetR/AcrR family transcriptional regulator [Mesorhizobium sp. DCY119]RJG40494.1 TetR/AcrR family transcriptional regulator [Mesorhizobium sp. DCY119]